MQKGMCSMKNGRFGGAANAFTVTTEENIQWVSLLQMGPKGCVIPDQIMYNYVFWKIALA